MADFRIGEALGETWRIFLKNFPIISVIAIFIYWLPPELIIRAMGIEMNDMRSYSLYNLISVPFSIMSATMLTAVGLIGGKEDRLSFRKLFDTIGASWASYFGQSILSGLFFILGLALLIVPGIVIAVILSLAGPACLAEKLSAFQSLSRSQELVKGYGWQIFGYNLVLGLSCVGVVFIMSVIGGLAFGLFNADGLQTVETTRVGLIFDLAVGAVMSLPVTGIYIGIAVAYRKIRHAKEGDPDNSLAEVFS